MPENKKVEPMAIEGRPLDIRLHYLCPVLYVPNHANGDAGHKDCEKGVIISLGACDVRVLYCKSRTVQATDPRDLVWG